jgi:hypothetical protein
VKHFKAAASEQLAHLPRQIRMCRDHAGTLVQVTWGLAVWLLGRDAVAAVHAVRVVVMVGVAGRFWCKGGA